MSDVKRAWREELEAVLAEGRAAFKGQYAEELRRLEEMSKLDIEAVSPDTASLERYDDLVAVVRRASAKNYSRAQLREAVESLGETAVAIARKVGGILT